MLHWPQTVEITIEPGTGEYMDLLFDSAVFYSSFPALMSRCTGFTNSAKRGIKNDLQDNFGNSTGKSTFNRLCGH